MDIAQFDEIWEKLETETENIKCCVSTNRVSGTGEIVDAHASDHTLSVVMDSGNIARIPIYGVNLLD